MGGSKRVTLSIGVRKITNSNLEERLPPKAPSASLFQKLLANMDVQAKREASTALEYARQQMRAKLQNFTLWKSAADVDSTTIAGAFIKGNCRSIECELKSVKAHIESELKPTLMLRWRDSAVQWSQGAHKYRKWISKIQ